jgi:hypothetical protein
MPGWRVSGGSATAVMSRMVKLILDLFRLAKAAPSLEYAGPIPPEVQLYVVFSSGIAHEPENGQN